MNLKALTSILAIARIYIGLFWTEALILSYTAPNDCLMHQCIIVIVGMPWHMKGGWQATVN